MSQLMQSDPAPIVPYQSHQDALRFLFSAVERTNCVVLIQGPTGAGKTTILQAFMEAALRDTAVAFFDGIHLAPRDLLTGMLAQFNLQVGMQQDEQLMQTLSNYLARETRERCAPVLIIDNIDRAALSTLRLLNWLAALEAGEKYVVRIIMTGQERLTELVRDNAMRNLARRHPATFSLNPLTAYETMTYLRTRLMVAGGKSAENFFTPDVSYRLHELAGGWPGLLNTASLDVLERSIERASAKPAPSIILTRNGETLARYDLTERHYLVGRSDLADIVVEDGFVSKMHALLQVYPNVIILIDLNSTNGTTVNSRKVRKSVLRSDDIVMLGSYRLKLENAPTVGGEIAERLGTSDTVTMKTLTELRRARDGSTIAAIKEDSTG
jgi:type II secretory pathway predicted ATPase ExeA